MVQLIVAFVAWFIVFAAAAEPIAGQVVGVHDGDTITVLTAGKHQLKIRLAEIDAPELDQPYGGKAKQALADLVFGQVVSILPAATDRYGRTVGRVYREGQDVNLALVHAGAAWAFLKYQTDAIFSQAETAARSAQIGLWALQADQIMPPWEWRRPLPPMTAILSPYGCSGKRTCGQIEICDQAVFYLTQCGLADLDRDHDGIPCEATLCRSMANPRM